jgi:hypothetical protein
MSLLNIVTQEVVELDDSTLPEQLLGDLYSSALIGSSKGKAVYDIEELSACVSLHLMIMGNECGSDEEDEDGVQDIDLSLHIAFNIASENPEFIFVQQA